MMKVCAAQFRPAAGDFAANRDKHLALVELAVTQQADVLFFPELSLTGFEPALADALAIPLDDDRLDAFQVCSDTHHLMIGVGMPILAEGSVHIAMVWFAHNERRRLYAKQQLHPDEFRFFEPGHEQLVLERAGVRLTPAICYESLQMDHADRAAHLSSELYLASVAKPAGGLVKAMQHYPLVAQRHAMFVIMANSVGSYDDFVSVGQSAAWNRQGERLAQLDVESEGIIILDTCTGNASVKKLVNPVI